jgi:hypothetical protein
MPINEGTSLDMVQESTPYSFVKAPDTQEFDLSQYYSTHGQGAGFMNTYHESMSDVNDDFDRSMSGWIVNGEWNPVEGYHSDAVIEYLFDFKKLEEISDNNIKENLKTLSDYYKDGNFWKYINNIPDKIGKQCVQNPEWWPELKTNPEKLFMKIAGAIRVSSGQFTIYSLTQRQLDLIRKFVEDSKSFYGNNYFIIEQVHPEKYQRHKVDEFLSSVFKPKDAFQFQMSYGQDVNDSRWGSVISGEWWITDYGAEYADQDIGDQGHEAIAVNNLFDANAALDAAKESLQNDPENEDLEYLVEQIKENMSEEWGSSSVFFNVNIPDEIGIQAVDNPQIWFELKKDPRIPFMKYSKAIRVINNAFEVYTLNTNQIKQIKDFIKENIDEINWEEEMVIGQVDPGKSQYHRIIDFINFVNKPGEAWMETFTKQENDINDISLSDIGGALSQTWEKAKEVGTSVLQNVGLMDKQTLNPQPETPAKPIPAPIEQPQIQTPQKQLVMALQNYLQSPTPAAQSFLNGQKYSGPVDGNLGNQTRSVLSVIENNLNTLFETRKFSGTLVTTTPDDIESALQKAMQYKVSLSQKQVISSKDERFYKLGKFLIQKQRIV